MYKHPSAPTPISRSSERQQKSPPDIISYWRSRSQSAEKVLPSSLKQDGKIGTEEKLWPSPSSEVAPAGASEHMEVATAAHDTEQESSELMFELELDPPTTENLPPKILQTTSPYAFYQPVGPQQIGTSPQSSTLLNSLNDQDTPLSETEELMFPFDL